MQKNFDYSTAKNLIRQSRHLKVVKEFWKHINFPSLASSKAFPVRVISFSDVSRPSERGNLGVLSGIIMGHIQIESMLIQFTGIPHCEEDRLNQPEQLKFMLLDL